MTKKFDLKAKRKTIPELLYQSDMKGKVINPIPYIETDKTDPMPIMLIVEEVYKTDEFEPGENGEPAPVYEYEFHQFLDMRAVKAVLSEKQFDKVRVALGMEKVKDAKKKGNELLKKVNENIDFIIEAKKTGENN